MEFSRGFSVGRVGAFCFFSGIFLLLRCASAVENTTEPTANVNLGPIQQWRSAYFCLLHKATAGPCAGLGANKGILTPQGKLNVSSQDVPGYCSPGSCSDHIRFDVLKCIHLVHKRFVFANNGTVKSVNETLGNFCANPSSGLDLIIDKGPRQSSAIKAHKKVSVSLLLALLVIFINM